ncbi:MAG: hypothetical protein NZ560_03600, partial [Aquificaceae bacterium]|nr:hypothetical protein [Aquificaceae bacterium]
MVGLLRVLSKHEKTDEVFSLEDECVRMKTEMFEKIRKDKDTSRIKLVPFWHYWYVLESWSAIGDRAKRKWKAKEKEKEKTSKITISEEISYEFKKNEEYKNKIMEVIEKNLGKPTREFVESFIDVYGYLFFKLYRNYSPTGEYNIDEFIKKVGNIEKIKSGSPTPTNNHFCSFCNSSEYKLEPISVKYMNLLMPSYNEFPNSHWNCSADGIDMICSLCQFIIIHHHLAFTKIHDGSEIFINAPSFKLMYELNKLVKEIYSSKGKSKSVRKIL